MKKFCVVIAVGVFSSVVSADPAITISGAMEASVETAWAHGATGGTNFPSRQRVSSGGSSIAFKGEETIGNGVEVFFQIDTVVIVDQGLSFGPASRDTYVGMRSQSLGSVSMGMHSTPYRLFGLFMDPYWNIGVSGSGNLMAELAGVKLGFDNRLPNSIRYKSPNWSGFTTMAFYGANEGKTNSVSDSSWGIGALYDSKPMFLGYAYERRNDQITGALAPLGGSFSAASNGDQLTGHRLGGRYTFSNGASVGVEWDRQRIGANVASASLDIRRDAWLLSLTHKMGPHRFIAQYVQAEKTKGSAGCRALNCDDAARMFQVGYDYQFSKQTTVKFFYVQIQNRADAEYDFYYSPVGTTTTVNLMSANNLSAGADPRVFGVALRQLF